MEIVTADQVLPDDLRSGLARIGHSDILVGIPCFQSARTVPHVITAVEAGLRKFFPDLRATILVSDGGSSDRTVEVALAAGIGDDTRLFLVDETSPVPEPDRLGGPCGHPSLATRAGLAHTPTWCRLRAHAVRRL